MNLLSLAIIQIALLLPTSPRRRKPFPGRHGAKQPAHCRILDGLSGRTDCGYPALCADQKLDGYPLPLAAQQCRHVRRANDRYCDR